MRLALLCVAAVLASGCARARAPLAPPEPAALSVPAALEPAVRQAPFTLEIVDELNDGNQLRVLAKVTARAAWPVSDVLLRLTGMKAGETLDVSTYPLKNAMPTGEGGAAPAIAAGKSLNLSLTAPAAGITDYQLELLWGKDAQLATQSSEIQRRGALLKVRHIEVESTPVLCDEAPCPVTYTVTGELFNAGRSDITQATLGIGYVFLKTGEELDLQHALPEREEVVEVPSLHLTSGQQRPLKIVLDRPVPVVNGGYYQPVLRIIAFNGKRVG